ncbi:hypothetical protein L9F63_009241, partial [Diploptera punctata]
ASHFGDEAYKISLISLSSYFARNSHFCDEGLATNVLGHVVCYLIFYKLVCR